MNISLLDDEFRKRSQYFLTVWMLTAIIFALGGWSSKSWAAPIEWPGSSGGNNHWYELITTPETWSDAEAAAEALVVAGAPGHLATITSEAERSFVATNLTTGQAWLGGFQGPGASEPAGDWELVTGEPFVEFWRTNEPNNSPNDSDCLEFRGGEFNDRACGQAVAYIVEYEPDAPPPKTEQEDLTDEGGDEVDDTDFGDDMDLIEYGDEAETIVPMLAIGAPNDESSPIRGGKVYIYERIADPLPQWELAATLVAPTPEEGGGFGAAVVFDPEPDAADACLAVGSPGEDCMVNGNPVADCGAVYNYCYDGSTWNFSYKISPLDVGAEPQPPTMLSRGMNFGAELAMAVTNSRILVVGAPGMDRPVIGADVGEAYEFTINSPPVLSNTLSDLLASDDLMAGSEFGSSLAIARVGSYRIAVGAPGFDLGTGRVITFFKSSPLAKEQTFDAPAGVGSLGRFGTSVALSEDPHLFVGAPQLNGSTGAAYLYEFSSTGTLVNTLIGPSLGCEFGKSLAMDATAKFMLVGAPGCSGSPPGSGLVFPYFRSGFKPILANLVHPPTADESGGFGGSLVIKGGVLAVGEPGSETVSVFSFPDTDEDGVIDGVDNCEMIGNPDQTDSDGDGAGDACDPCPLDPDDDADQDGVCGDIDNCPNTPLGEVVNASGCSIDQLCPCENDWQNHGAYVSCVAKTALSFHSSGLIDACESGSIISEAARSDCGANPHSKIGKYYFSRFFVKHWIREHLFIDINRCNSPHDWHRHGRQ